jgi:hypothetical protein
VTAFAAAGLRDVLLRPGWLDQRSVFEYAPPSPTGSLVTMNERPVSGPLGALRGARLIDLVIQARNAEELRRLRRLAQARPRPEDWRWLVRLGRAGAAR